MCVTELQGQTIYAREDYAIMDQDANNSMRIEALHRFALLALKLCGFSPEGGLLHPVEEILMHLAPGITACWHLRKSKEITLASNVVGSYIPTLWEATMSSTPPQRKIALDLLVQCLLLKADLGKHLEGYDEAISYAQQAETCSRMGENSLQQIVSARMMAATHYYAEQYDQALQAAERAQHILKQTRSEKIPQIVHSYVYAGLATYQAYAGLVYEAQASLRKAHKAFIAQSPDEQVPIWVHHSEANLYLNDGMTYFYLGRQKKALQCFAKVDSLQDKSELLRIEALLDGVMAEVQREDSARDMEWCLNRWMPAIKDAKALYSELLFNDAVKVYMAMCGAWPGEKRIRDQREMAVRWHW